MHATSSKTQDEDLDRHTEVLSHIFQNPCTHLPVRPLDKEEALAVTGIAAYVPPRQELHRYRTARLCQSLAGNSFHPNLVLATLAAESNLRKYVSGGQHAECVDTTNALAPQQVREHFATTILAPILEHLDRKKHLQQAWRTQEERLHTLNPYCHLQCSNPHSTNQPPAVQYGQPDDHTALYRQAKQLRDSEEAYANHQLVPAIIAGAVHDHLIATGCQDILLALRATRYANVNKAEWIKDTGTQTPVWIYFLERVILTIFGSGRSIF